MIDTYHAGVIENQILFSMNFITGKHKSAEHSTPEHFYPKSLWMLSRVVQQKVNKRIEDHPNQEEYHKHIKLEEEIERSE
jgi:hypothetical protein